MDALLDNSHDEHLYRPNCVEEWLELIHDIGFDYDGFNTVDSLKDLVDELVDMAKNAMVCLRNGYLFHHDVDEEDFK